MRWKEEVTPEYQVTIVGRTWAGKMLCIGALSGEYQSLRLKRNDEIPFWYENNCPFTIGSVHEIFAEPELNEENPHHKEDVRVITYRRCIRQLNARQLIEFIEGGDLVRETILPNKAFRYSGLRNPMHRTWNNTYYIPKPKLEELEESTVFWRTPVILRLVDSRYQCDNPCYTIKYVGCQDPIQEIPVGTIVRLSTSAYFDQIDGSSLQLSGWFL